LNLGRWLLRPEIIGTALVVAAAAILPFLLPLADVVTEFRDGLVRTFGVHVFTLIALLAAAGALLATQRTEWLTRHVRHVAGGLLLVVFSAGLLGVWYPATTVGHVDLNVASAGGRIGRALASWPGVLISLLAFVGGFALLWPVTAREIALKAPPAIAGAARSFWGLGLHRSLARGVRSFFAKPEPPPDLATLGWPPVAEAPALPAVRAVAAEKAAAPAPEAPPIRKQMPMDLDHPVGEWRHSADGWMLPPMDMLEASKVNETSELDNRRRAQLIVDTLDSFGVDSRVIEVNEGPTVTQFGVEPGWDVRTRSVQERDATGQPILDEFGQPKTKDVEVSRTRIRVNRITALQNDLALALAAPGLRIEAPVPGKSMVGIEVPNASSSVVALRTIMESPAFRTLQEKGKLPVALGAGVSGSPIVADLSRMPHLLIAGATGSGKSVCLNSIITCLLMNFSPQELRLVLVDPKRVELTPYQDVPHLAFSKIVVDMDKVVGTLQAVINEMDSRYRRFEQAGVRDIIRYNAQASQKLPYWVVVIDELADLMLVAPFQVENQIVRLAQLARATGIHLIIATQRPSVDVVTGLIKANFPTRIAFAVASQVDSRTVLDRAGAEKLLGRGDMLYVPTDAQAPMRVQGVFLSDKEIEAVVDFWTADRFKDLVPEKHDELLAEAEEQAEALLHPEEAEQDDPMLSKAIELARETRTLSTSMLQRRLRIGYPRAARIMDELEDRGVVAAAEPGGSSREVLLEGEILVPADPREAGDL